MAKAHQKAVLVTGCDVPNAYGYELALCLDKQGYTVFAGCDDCNSVGARSIASRGSTRLAVLQIDVTKQEEIDDAKEMIEDLVGEEGLWAVVNCAEAYAVAEVEWFANKDFDRLLQINFLGVVRVVKAMLPLLRRAKGRVVNLSSVSGCVSRAGQSAFAASKFALEAFSDSLRQEMRKWGVYVALVQPAFFPRADAVLSDPETSARLKSISQETKAIYGEDYFINYIRSLSSSSSNDTDSDASSSGSNALLSKNCNSTKDGEEPGNNQRRKKVVESAGSLKQQNVTQPSSSASSTLKSQGKGSNVYSNQVLHALVEATTTPSPKVRYFIGTFHDRMLKSLNHVLPSVLLDTYYISGEMAKVVPKHIKEKWE